MASTSGDRLQGSKSNPSTRNNLNQGATNKQSTTKYGLNIGEHSDPTHGAVSSPPLANISESFGLRYEPPYTPAQKFVWPHSTTHVQTTASKTNVQTPLSFQEPFAPQMPARVDANELPNCWPQSLKLWFKVIEAVFESKPGLTDDAKYIAVILHLDHDQVAAVEHVIDNPPSTNKYQVLKEALTKNQFQKLISGLQLTGKPSELFRKIRSLANDFDESFVTTLWLDRLPVDLQRVLPAEDSVDVKALTKLADTIMDVLERRGLAQPHTVSANTKTNTHSDFATSNTHHMCQEQITKLTQQIEKLTEQIEKLTKQTAKLSEQFNTMSTQDIQGLGTSKDRHRQLNKSRDRSQGACHFHAKFGPNANKCAAPCFWSDFHSKQKENANNHQ